MGTKLHAALAVMLLLAAPAVAVPALQLYSPGGRIIDCAGAVQLQCGDGDGRCGQQEHHRQGCM
jgi:hypothetical protein